MFKLSEGRRGKRRKLRFSFGRRSMDILDFIRPRKSFDVARSGWRPTAQSVNESRARWAMHSDNNLLNERFSLLRALAIVFLEGKAEGTSRCYLRLLWAMRIFFFPSELRRFRYLPLNSHLDDHARSDPLYFLVHKYYISKHFTLRQRLRSALDHHEFELRNFTESIIDKFIHRTGY